MCASCFGGANGVKSHICEEVAIGSEWTTSMTPAEIKAVVHKRVDKIINWRDMKDSYKDGTLYEIWQLAARAAMIRRDNVVKDPNHVEVTSAEGADKTHQAFCFKCKEERPLTAEHWSVGNIKALKNRLDYPREKPHWPLLCKVCSTKEEMAKGCSYTCAGIACGHVILSGANSSRGARAPDHKGQRLCKLCNRMAESARQEAERLQGC